MSANPVGRRSLPRARWNGCHAGGCVRSGSASVCIRNDRFGFVSTGAAILLDATARCAARVADKGSDYAVMDERALARAIKRLEKEMQEHARNLEFEKAAAVRDELFKLRQRAFGADQHGSV